MIRYIIKRLLLFIPTLFVISLLAFVISVKAPGDPVEILSGSGAQGGNSNQKMSKVQKDSIRTRLGLDLPLFYFSLATQADSDTLYKITDKSHRNVLDRLTRRYGNWSLVSEWYIGLQAMVNWQNQWDADLIHQQSGLGNDSLVHEKYSRNSIVENQNKALNSILGLMGSSDEKVIENKLDTLVAVYANAEYFEGGITKADELKQMYNRMKNEAGSWNLYLPALHWYGVKNQYHHWLMRLLLHGDFGYSYIDKEPITEKIWTKFFISFKLILLSVLIAYLISIPIGVYSAYRKGSWTEKGIGIFLFMLYSLPSFFVGMLLLYFFANPDFVVWFPEAGYMDPNNYSSDWPLLKRWEAEWPYMILPLVTYTYSSFAFISRIMRSAMLDQLSQDYVRTARAKGMSEREVIWRHAFRNSLLPVITIFVNIFPMAVGGSVIIETIFTYPGMGLGSYEAIHNYDYPAIVAIFTLSGFLTMLAYLLADVLYAIADPRISYGKK